MYIYIYTAIYELKYMISVAISTIQYILHLVNTRLCISQVNKLSERYSAAVTSVARQLERHKTWTRELSGYLDTFDSSCAMVRDCCDEVDCEYATSDPTAELRTLEERLENIEVGLRCVYELVYIVHSEVHVVYIVHTGVRVSVQCTLTVYKLYQRCTSYLYASCCPVVFVLHFVVR